MPFLSEFAAAPLPGAPQITLARCRYDTSAYADHLFGALGVEMADNVRNAVAKRKAEFLAGRYLAGCLLDSNGLPGSLATGVHRQPLWPEGWVGSITHARDAAAVIIAQESRVSALGIDLEHWLSDRLAEDIRASIVSHEELLALAAWPLFEALTLAFSAKESVFKALYPKVGRYFDFSAARIVALDTRRSVLSVEICEPLSTHVVPGLRLEIAYCRGRLGVFTAVACGVDDLELGETMMPLLS